jgi:hypothetical protein
MASQPKNIAPLVDLVEAWRGDIAQFVIDQFGATPSEQQTALLRAVAADGAHIAAKSGHGTGKSTTASWLILWGLCCFRDVKIPCTAPTKHQLEDILWAEVRKWHGRMLEPWKSSIRITSDRITIEGLPGIAVARTGRKENPEALQGFHADELLFIIDEASGVDDTVFEVARGALSTPKARVIMLSNPTRTTGFFHRAFNINRDGWDCYTLSCVESPHVAREYIEEMRREYGEDSDIYKVRVLGEFPSGGDLQFIPSAVVEEAAKRYYRESAYSFAPILLGVDVAWYGGDKSVVYMRQGLYVRKLFSVMGCEPSTLAGIVARYEDELGAEAVFIDATGIGAGVVSNLRMMGREPFAVMLGGASADPTYLNKRAECWGLMRKWLTEEQGWIPDDEHLKNDLCAPDYGYNMTGKLQLERKEDMKKRGLASPDDADALALTFAAPVGPRKTARDILEEIRDEYSEKKRFDVFTWKKGR